jgi:hypothetical protein
MTEKPRAPAAQLNGCLHHILYIASGIIRRCQTLLLTKMKRTREIMSLIGIVLALIAAVSIQAANKDGATSFHVFVSWICAQAPFFYYYDTKDDVSLQLKVIDWVVENGGYFNSKQEIRRLFPGGPYGIFATDVIEKGELIVSVPWKCVMTAGTDDFETYVYCNTTQYIIDEMRKENDSFYAPYTRYLKSAPPVNIPSMWSDDAKHLLHLLIGKNQVPPKRATKWFTLYKEECDGSDDPYEVQAAMQLITRGDDDKLTPVYDMYNHRNGKWLNTSPKMHDKRKHDMYASRLIRKGEEIYLSYNQCIDCWNRHYDFGTPDIFRDYGFVEQYPQRWIFPEEEIAFDIDEGNDGTLHVIWLDERVDKKFGELYQVTDWGINVLKSQLRRVKDVYETDIKPVVEGTSDVKIPQHELEPLLSYYHALTTALQLAIEDYDDSSDNDDDEDDE